MPYPTNPHLKKIDELIRIGRGAQAKTQLLELTSKGKVPRGEAATVAQLAWRAGLALIGIRVLNPLVRGTNKTPAVATEEEKAEYAQCLSKIGATDEAQSILQSIDGKREPKAHRYVAAVEIARWNYAAAIPHLIRYIKTDGVDGYERLVGKVNLAAALVEEDHYDKARYLLHELAYETSLQRLWLLHGDVLELSAQNAIFHRKWELAQRFLAKAENCLSQSDSIDAFFIKKWKAILMVLRSEGKQGITELETVRHDATARGKWETVRDADRFEALATRSKALFVHLYFGTPLPAFKTRLRKLCPEVDIPDEFVWFPGKEAPRTLMHKSPHWLIEAATGQTNQSGIFLKTGHTLHRLVVVLSSDFYRPFRIATLYGRLFPEEHFNPQSSPGRVHQAIKLLKRYFQKSKIPLSIEEISHFYRLSATAEVGIRVGVARDGTDRVTVHLECLRASFPEKAFSVKEAATTLRISDRSTLRVLMAGIEQAQILRQGKRAFARYRFDRPSEDRLSSPKTKSLAKDLSAEPRRKTR